MLPGWKTAWSNVALSQKVLVLSGSLLVEGSDARGFPHEDGPNQMAASKKLNGYTSGHVNM
jgi:hypothetical protein